MVLLLVLGPRLLPEHRDPASTRLDPASAALSLVGLLGLIYALKEAARNGFDTTALAALLVGLAAGTAFVRRQRVLPDPLLDLRLFRSGAFSSAIGSMLAAQRFEGNYLKNHARPDLAVVFPQGVTRDQAAAVVRYGQQRIEQELAA